MNGHARGSGRAAPRILLVDDDARELELLQQLLAPLSPQVFTAGARDALEQLGRAEPDLIMLDRGLRGVDGLELLRRLRREESGLLVPVILRADTASLRDTREAIDAGAAYCVAKAVDDQLLLAVVRGALHAAGHGSHRSKPENVALAHLRAGSFEFCTLDDVQDLAFELSQLCPQSECVAMGLAELMLNAVEHGNLEITYQEKSQLCRHDAWRAEIERRLQLAKFRDRRACVEVRRGNDAVVFRVSDDGPGFAWGRFLGFEQERAQDPNGRGIALAREIAFKTLRYEGRGNIVTAEVPLESD